MQNKISSRSKSYKSADGDDSYASGKNRIFVQQNVSYEYTILLDGEITDIIDYAEELAILRGCSEDDVVYLQINSIGGNVDTAVAFIRHIRECRAPVIGHIGFLCISAATMIALACDDWELDAFSKWMVHSVTYGASGKDVDVFDRVLFDNKQHEKLVRLIYDGFLSQDEIVKVIDGRELYFDAEELAIRFDRLKKYRYPDELNHEEDITGPVNADDPTTWPIGSVVQFTKALAPFTKGETVEIKEKYISKWATTFECWTDDKYVVIPQYNNDRIKLIALPNEEEDDEFAEEL